MKNQHRVLKQFEGISIADLCFYHWQPLSIRFQALFAATVPVNSDTTVPVNSNCYSAFLLARISENTYLQIIGLKIIVEEYLSVGCVSFFFSTWGSIVASRGI